VPSTLTNVAVLRRFPVCPEDFSRRTEAAAHPQPVSVVDGSGSRSTAAQSAQPPPGPEFSLRTRPWTRRLGATPRDPRPGVGIAHASHLPLVTEKRPVSASRLLRDSCRSRASGDRVWAHAWISSGPSVADWCAETLATKRKWNSGGTASSRRDSYGRRPATLSAGPALVLKLTKERSEGLPAKTPLASARSVRGLPDTESHSAPL
jgi:hypothetical protein